MLSQSPEPCIFQCLGEKPLSRCRVQHPLQLLGSSVQGGDGINSFAGVGAAGCAGVHCDVGDDNGFEILKTNNQISKQTDKQARKQANNGWKDRGQTWIG